jgi:Cys-tRNA(Pro)/Cys-tRNA(Cys) deacylase
LRGDKTGVIEACIPAGFDLDLESLAKLSGNEKATMVNAKELFVLTGQRLAVAKARHIIDIIS